MSRPSGFTTRTLSETRTVGGALVSGANAPRDEIKEQDHPESFSHGIDVLRHIVPFRQSPLHGMMGRAYRR